MYNEAKDLIVKEITVDKSQNIKALITDKKLEIELVKREMINKDQLQNKEEIPMIDIKIDGKAISIPKTRPHSVTGKQEPTTIIQACSIAGVDIPHFCYHPRLPVSRL